MNMVCLWDVDYDDWVIICYREDLPLLLEELKINKRFLI